MKHLIQESYRQNKFYLWCSENFDGNAAPRYSASSLVAPSSNPSEIYRTLKSDVQRSDKHSTKINEQKMLFTKLEVDWESDGQITTEQKEEIIYLVGQNDFSQWRPLLIVIPVTESLLPRLKLVPMEKRASVTKEYIIEDLDKSEFDIIEF